MGIFPLGFYYGAVILAAIAVIYLSNQLKKAQKLVAESKRIVDTVKEKSDRQVELSRSLFNDIEEREVEIDNLYTMMLEIGRYIIKEPINDPYDYITLRPGHKIPVDYHFRTLLLEWVKIHPKFRYHIRVPLANDCERTHVNVNDSKYGSTDEIAKRTAERIERRQIPESTRATVKHRLPPSPRPSSRGSQHRTVVNHNGPGIGDIAIGTAVGMMIADALTDDDNSNSYDTDTRQDSYTAPEPDSSSSYDSGSSDDSSSYDSGSSSDSNDY